MIFGISLMGIGGSIIFDLIYQTSTTAFWWTTGGTLLTAGAYSILIALASEQKGKQ